MMNRVVLGQHRFLSLQRPKFSCSSLLILKPFPSVNWYDIQSRQRFATIKPVHQEPLKQKINNKPLIFLIILSLIGWKIYNSHIVRENWILYRLSPVKPPSQELKDLIKTTGLNLLTMDRVLVMGLESNFLFCAIVTSVKMTRFQ